MRTHHRLALPCSAILFLAASCNGPSPVGPDVRPLPKAHAHNDYEHQRPLYDALSHGFTSVEADIFLIDGELLVAHDRRDVTAERTLRGLYLEPLRRLARENGGNVYRGGPQITLLIDIKSDAVETYTALDKLLAEYDDIMTSFGPDGRCDKAVAAVISGNRPLELMRSQSIRHAAYDGRLSDLESDEPATLIALISDNWNSHFTWKGDGSMPAAEQLKLREIVKTAHEKGRTVRFWATPDKATEARLAVWEQLLSAGVDMINTDDLAGLQQFLLSARLR